VKIRDLYIEVRVSADKAIQALRQADKESKAAAKGIGALRDASGKARDELGRFTKSGRGFIASIGDIAKSVTGLSLDIGSLASSIAGSLLSPLKSVTDALKDPIGASIEFESSMAEIAKVVDGLKTPTGEVTAEFGEMKDAIFDLSSEIAIAPKGFADIIAAAGQAGIARDELTGFAADAAKMAVAFDIGADQAGDAMAKLRTGLGLSQVEVNNLAGTMNHLSNNMASSAPELLDVAKRVGALGGAAGLSAEQVTAIGSAMISSGAKSSVASIGVKNFTLALAAGETVTKAQGEAYQRLGLDSVEVAKNFAKGGKDTEATIMDVLSRIKDLDQAERSATVKQLFGKESMGSIAPLITQIDNLGKAFEFAADETAAADSVQGEYNVRSKTTANNVQLLSNRVTIAAIKIGDMLLPAFNDLLGVFMGGEMDGFGDAIMSEIDGMIGAVKDAAPAVKELLVGMFNDAVPAIGPLIETLRSWIGSIAENASRGFEKLGPIFSSLMGVVTRLTEVLGFAGEEGEEFGSTIAESMGDALVSVLDAVLIVIDALNTSLDAMMPILKPIADFLRTAIFSAFDAIAGIVDVTRQRFATMAEALESFTSGRFADGFIKLGQAILDGLVEPLRIVARMLIELADAIPGGAAVVPAALRQFAGATATAGALAAVKKAASAEAARSERVDAAASAPVVEEPALAVGAELPAGFVAKPAEEGEGGEGGEGGDGEGDGKGKGKGKGKKKKKKGKDNLLDQAVKDAGKKALGGTDKSTSGVGPSVTNIYFNFQQEIDARGMAEGVEARAKRGAEAGARRGAEAVKGAYKAGARAKGGGGMAAGAG